MQSTKPEVNLVEIVNIINRDYGPVEKIILFGSHARGDADVYSDLDLIVIKKNVPKNFIERLGQVPLFPIHADTFVYTPEEFETMRQNKNPFIINALESAKVIYEKTKRKC